VKEESRPRLFDNKALRIFGPKTDGIRGQWRKLHNEELNDLCCSSNIVRMIESRIMRWAGIYRLWGRGEAYVGFWWGTLSVKDNLEDLDLEGNIIYQRIFKEWDKGGMDWIYLA
jgi:hypothetical protein